MILASLVLAAAVAQAGDPILIRVDDASLTRIDVTERAAELRARGFQASGETVTDNLIAEALLAAAARAPGGPPAKAVQIAAANERQRLLADLYVSRVLAKRAPVTDEQLQHLFHQGDSVRLQVVVFTSREEAKASMERLKVSHAWAVEAAQAASKVKFPGGESGEVTRALLDPALAEAAFKAPLNVLTGPTELGLGWAVFSVLERNLGNAALFEARRPALVAMATASNRSAVRQHVVSTAKAQAKITIDDSLLEQIGKRLAVSDAEAERTVASIDGRAISYAEVAPLMRGLGGPAGGHMSGPTIKRQIISTFIDERLLANAAIAASVDKDPEIARRIRRGEVRAIADLTADFVRATRARSSDPSSREKAVADFVAGLRKRARIQLDSAAIAATISG